MKQRKNQEARNRAMLLAVVIFLASAVISLTLNLLFAGQRETKANRR
ncbi:MAG: hypothetical protein J2P52_05210 [Blastocatellia bacterium]|nr:hypothetical protein [Blastocatellia bacterium]